MKEAVIVSAVRTPLGGFNGSLSGIGATDLGGLVIEAAVRRADIENDAVDEVIMGLVLPCGYGQNIHDRYCNHFARTYRGRFHAGRCVPHPAIHYDLCIGCHIIYDCNGRGYHIYKSDEFLFAPWQKDQSAGGCRRRFGGA